MKGYKRLKLKRRWRFYKPGAVVGPIQSNVAALLVRRGIGEYIAAEPKTTKPTRRRKTTDGENAKR